MMIFPNPVISSFNLGWSQIKDADLSIRLTNIQGQTVKNIELGNVAAGQQNIAIDTNELNSGWYSLSIVGANSVQTLKVQIIK